MKRSDLNELHYITPGQMCRGPGADRVDPRFIQGGYVSCQENQKLLEDTGFQLPITVDPKLFFQI
jgi:hypothetical protein